MSERIAIITGAASGLGLASAQRLANEGLAVHLLDVSPEALAAAGKQVSDQGGKVTSLLSDIRTQAACRAAVDAAIEQHGRVDVLVNCAGVYPRAPILDISEEQWRLDLDVNVLGTYFMMVESIGHMRKRGRGHIVNVSSIDAFVAHPGNAHYAATKAAVVSLTRSFALEVAPFGILVNSVAPGPMATERAKQSDWYHDMVAGLPTGKPIEPAEVADLVSYLCREENVSITGENVLISGGGTIV